MITKEEIAMRICFVFSRFKMLTGAEHLAIEFANGLVARGHSVSIVTRAIERHCHAAFDRRIRVVLPRYGKALTGIQFLDSIGDLALSPLLFFALPRDAEVMVFWVDTTLAALWLQKKIRRPSAPCLYYCLQPAHFAYDRIWLTVRSNLPLSLLIPVFVLPYRCIDKMFVRSADNVLVLSKAMEKICTRLYRPRSIAIAHAGVRAPANVSPEDASANAPPVLLTVGKLIPKKNVDQFIRVIAELTARKRDVRGMIVGGGPCMDDLRRLLRELRLEERVVMTGYLTNDDEVDKAYQQCAVYLYLEENVPFGLTVLEAGIRGKPVIAAAGGGVDETIIHGTTGFIVDRASNTARICDFVEQLLDNTEMRAAMCAQAIAHARTFDYAAKTDVFAGILEKAVCQAARARPRKRRAIAA
jgi:glycosyltransferase involved in cell wall biosynthesis